MMMTRSRNNNGGARARQLVLEAGVFPVTSFPRTADIEVIRRQIGRQPRGTILVVARCPHRRPSVILTLPYADYRKSRPPLLWLTCPHACRETGRLESRGAVRQYAARLLEEPGQDRLFRQTEAMVALLQKALMVLECGRVYADRIGPRGVTGGKKGAIKCLHSHLAFTLAVSEEKISSNPRGPRPAMTPGAYDLKPRSSCLDNGCPDRAREQGSDPGARVKTGACRSVRGAGTMLSCPGRENAGRINEVPCLAGRVRLSASTACRYRDPSWHRALVSAVVVNPPGEWCLEELEKDRGVYCDRIHPACIC